MKRPLAWSLQARKAFRDIVSYIAQENPRAAAQVADRIDEAVRRLGEFATGRPGRVSGTFEKVVPGLPYIIAYEIEEEAHSPGRVTILHIVHGSRNWPDDKWPSAGRSRPDA